MGRDRGPLSPPTIAQWIPVKSALETGPNKGSNEMKRNSGRHLSEMLNATKIQHWYPTKRLIAVEAAT